LSEFVLDNSVTMRWCFEGTATTYSERVLENLLQGSRAHVPVLWLYEVVAVLAKAQRTGSITGEKVHGFLEDLRSLDIRVDNESVGYIFGDVYQLAVERRLSGYDAAYLELAARKSIPLATLDQELAAAATMAGVELTGGRL